MENNDLEPPLTLDNYVILHNVLHISGSGCLMYEKEVMFNIKVNSKHNSMWKIHAWYLKKILKIILITIIQCFLPRNTSPYLDTC